MTFKVEFTTDNAAFEDDNGPLEIARVLRVIARDIEDGASPGCASRIRDVNGNRIGEWEWLQ